MRHSSSLHRRHGEAERQAASNYWLGDGSIHFYLGGCVTLDPTRRRNNGLRGEHDQTLSRTAFGSAGPTCREETWGSRAWDIAMTAARFVVGGTTLASSPADFGKLIVPIRP
jgi:hypothetical protein